LNGEIIAPSIEFSGIETAITVNAKIGKGTWFVKLEVVKIQIQPHVIEPTKRFVDII
jgi:hypothetical protein